MISQCWTTARPGSGIKASIIAGLWIDPTMLVLHHWIQLPQTIAFGYKSCVRTHADHPTQTTEAPYFYSHTDPVTLLIASPIVVSI